MSDVCTIYLATNQVNLKPYVGQTWQPMKKRWHQHRGASPRSKCPKFHNAIQKYGQKAFTLETLATATDQRTADALEAFWIRTFNCVVNGYNIRPGGRNARMSKQTRLKMSQIAKAQGRRPPAFVGPMTAEHKRKLSEAHKGLTTWNKGARMSEETRRKVSQNNGSRLHFTAEQVAAICKDPRPHRLVATEYGCSDTTIRGIRRRSGADMSAWPRNNNPSARKQSPKRHFFSAEQLAFIKDPSRTHKAAAKALGCSEGLVWKIRHTKGHCHDDAR